MADNNTVILRVSLDEGKTEDQLKKLVLDIENTREAMSSLASARLKGKVNDEDYTAGVVKLRAQLKAQTQEQTALTKNLELYRTATGELGNTYKGTQAQLSLAQRQFQLLDGSQDNSTESAQALTGVIDGLRNTLKATDAQQSLFIRNVGNYPKGENVAQLLQELVKLQEAQKGVTQSTEESARAQMRITGFQTAAQQALAKEGKSYEEATNFIHGYTESIRPAVANLVKLEDELEKVEEGSEAFAKIGFQIGQAKKEIADTPKEVQGVTDTIAALDEQTGAFGGQVANLKQRFATAKQGIDLAKGGFTGLKGAIASTGIGVLILALGALYEYFTKTDEGAEDLAAGLAYLKGLFSVLEAVVIGAGKGLVLVFKDPQKAGKELLEFLESQLINRVKAFGVIWDGIRNGDFKTATNGILQFQTGIEDSIGKVQQLGAEMKSAAEAAASISRAKDELEDIERGELVRTEKYRNEIERLVLTAKDRTLTEKERLANLDKAGKLETETLEATINLARQRLSIIERENFEAARTGTISDEARTAAAEAEAEIVKLAGQSLSLQQSIQNRRSALLQAEAAEEKAAAAKAKAEAEKREELRLQLRRDGLALEALLLDRQLQTVQANSDQELSLLQQKLRNGYQAELAVKNLTVAAKKNIDTKYENESLALARDFAKQRILAVYDASVAANAAELAAVQKGTDAETELRREAIDVQLQHDLAALDRRKDIAAQEVLLRANAAKATNDVNYNAALAKLDGFLSAQRSALDESNARGLISEKEYAAALLVSDQIAAGSRLQLAREFKQETIGLEKAATDAKIAGLRAVTAAEKAEHEKRVAQAQALTEGLTSLFLDTVATTGATLQDFARKSLILLIDSVEKSIIAAQIKIIAEAFASADSIATFGVSGAIKAALVIGLVGAAAETLKAKLQPTSSQQFAEGTVLGGASHANGGVQLYSRTGHHFGEAEASEIILTKGVWQNPVLRPMASMLNVMGGGRPLVPSSYLATGGITSATVRDNVRGGVASVSPEQLGAAVATALKKNPPVTRWVDFEDAGARARFTDSISDG